MSSTSLSAVGTITLPLTTVFTPPAWCNDLPFTYQTAFHGVSQYIRDASGPGNGQTSACYPPDFGVFKTGISLGIYSPGICPSGWLAHTIPHTKVDPTVSWSICCPNSFTASLQEDVGWSCLSSVTTPTTMFLNEDTAVRVTTDLLVADWPILIAWQSSDLDRFTPASAPITTTTSESTSSSSTGNTRLTSPTATSTRFTTSRTRITTSKIKTKVPSTTKSPSASSHHFTSSTASTARSSSIAKAHSGLPTTVKAGIGVGAAVAFLAIVAALALFSVRRKRRSRAEHGSHRHGRSGEGAIQLQGIPVSELSNIMKPNKQHYSQIHAELPAGWHGHEI